MAASQGTDVRRRRAGWAVAGSCILLLGIWLLAPRSQPALPEYPRRETLSLPDPTPAERAAFFLQTIRKGEELELGDLRPPVWRLVGFAALKELGRDAAEFLFDPARLPLLRSDPALASNILSLLPDLHDALRSPGLYPFLLRWLDPPFVPSGGGDPERGGDWAALFRRQVFALFTHVPDVRALPFCEVELARVAPPQDLRAAALSLALRLGRADLVEAVYPTLPPNAAEPEGTLRYFALDRVEECAAATDPPALRAQALRLEPLVRTLLASPLPFERIRAARILWRLGDRGTEQILLRSLVGPEEEETWFAIQALASLGKHPRAREVCLERVRKARASGTLDPRFPLALEILTREWPDDDAVRAELRALFLAAHRVDPFLSAQLLGVDRALVVDRLRRDVASADDAVVAAALDVARALAVTEAGPAILDRARRADGAEERVLLFGTLAFLRTEGGPALFVEAIDPSRDDALRAAAGACILDTGEPSAMRALGAALERGDRSLLDMLLRRAVAQGAGILPPPLREPLLRRLRESPQEASRRSALLILRLHGRKEGLLPALQEAYRHEPSDRVAGEIAATARELAHR
ncbi:MAG: hypothetical protein ACT4PV_04240 [Planctomycetaceae bacterium]